MVACWSEPNAKHAYILSWFSVTVTFACFVAGIVLYMVGAVLMNDKEMGLRMLL